MASENKKGPENNRPLQAISGEAYFSPPETLLPQRAFDPQRGLLPHNALLPHKALLPQRAFDPQRALLPQRAFDPHRALLPASALFDVAPLDAAEVPVTNCDDPQTAAFDQVAEVFQTAEGSSERYTSFVFELDRKSVV